MATRRRASPNKRQSVGVDIPMQFAAASCDMPSASTKRSASNMSRLNAISAASKHPSGK